MKDMSKIRIITPIISAGFRDDAPLHAAVPHGCEVSNMFIENGPASVESAVDEVLAGPGVIEASLRAEVEGMQVLVIDCMLDPALDAVREAVSIPVIGCGESGMRSAAAIGAFSIVTVLQRQERAFRALAARNGLAESLVSVRGIGVSVLDLERNRKGSIVATIHEARRAADEDGAQAIIFGCTGMLGFAAPVAEALAWDNARIIDPLPHAVALAHAVAETGGAENKAYHPAPEPKEIRGFSGWPLLSNTMEGKA